MASIPTDAAEVLLLRGVEPSCWTDLSVPRYLYSAAKYIEGNTVERSTYMYYIYAN